MEINDLLLLIRDIVEQAAANLDLPQTALKGPGRPKHNPADGAKGILMAQYFGLSNRAAQGYMLLFKEKLHLTSLFSYKTIERAYSDTEVRQILQEVFELTNKPVADLEHEFGPDGSGLATSFNSRTMKRIAKKIKLTRGVRRLWLWGVLSISLFLLLGLQISPLVMMRHFLSLY
ncbi:MAG: hypothetical protein LBI79_05195 [Nitrososphaerota archaeon]|jgi:hypothetical protein|nr:hypothetical protein [Nitrososphaerota archaeon]